MRDSVLLRAIFVVSIGLLAAQVIASIHVHSSNLTLYDKMQALRDAGYLIVPNTHVLPRLLEWKQAVLGGLFYTLTLGIFLILLSLAAAWLRNRMPPRKKIALYLLLIPWLALLVAVNSRGFTIMATLYFLVIPPLVYSAASLCLFKYSPRGSRRLAFFHAFSILLLALLWSTQIDRPFFIDVRDYLLLSNPAGTKINDFYYSYTLYPAEAFKSLGQKSMRTVFLKEVRSKRLTQALERELLKHDYLAVEREKSAELVISECDQQLQLQYQGETVSSAKFQEFLSSPRPWLADFSARTDVHRFLRKFTFVSLLVAFPLFCYFLLYAVILLLLSPFLSPGKSAFVSNSLCFLSGLVLLFFFFTWRGAIHDQNQVEINLKSGDPVARVAALKFIDSKKLEITVYPDYQKFLNSPSVLERCWLVKTLASSNRATSFANLLVFLDDPHPTVVSESFQALAGRRDDAAIPHILEKIATSRHWYNQLNAYMSLRSLGWKQSRSR
jgi:hypothetical protein